MNKLSIFLLCALLPTSIQCEVITPEDITQNRPQTTSRITLRGCQSVKTWPDIPSFIYETAKEFASQYADYRISLELGDVTIYYKGGHEAKYHDYKIPTVVYGLWFKDNTAIHIEANSRTVLYFQIPFVVYEDAFKNEYEQEPLTNAELFSKIIPLLDLYEVSSDLDEYEIIQIYTNKKGAIKGENSPESRCILTIIRSKEEHPFQSKNYIHLRVNRYTGQLMELIYIPSLDKISEWCELVETKKEK